jgi:beta-glucosidase
MSVATTPVPGNDFFEEQGIPEQWSQTNDFMNFVVSQIATSSKSPRLLFVGDSILYGLQVNAPGCWNKHYAEYNSLSLSIMGDQTQHILWRLDNGNLDGLKPEVIVVLAGTNNSLKNSAGETFDALQAIVQLLMSKCRGAKIILLELLPRFDDQLADAECQKVNVLLRSAYGEGKQESANNMVELISLEHVFRSSGSDVPAVSTAHGLLIDDLLIDDLHPSPAGYELIAQELASTLMQSMQTNRAAVAAGEGGGPRLMAKNAKSRV